MRTEKNTPRIKSGDKNGIESEKVSFEEHGVKSYKSKHPNADAYEIAKALQLEPSRIIKIMDKLEVV